MGALLEPVPAAGPDISGPYRDKRKFIVPPVGSAVLCGLHWSVQGKGIDFFGNSGIITDTGPPGQPYMETYRSGHNGADSKDSIPKVRTSANFSDCTRDPPGSNFQNFISFLRVVLLFSKTGYTHEIYGELSEWSKVQHSKCALALAVFSAENP